jgi:hypothetical protein
LAVVAVAITTAVPLSSTEKPVAQAAAEVLKEELQAAAAQAHPVKAITGDQAVLVRDPAAVEVQALVEMAVVVLVLAVRGVPDFHRQLPAQRLPEAAAAAVPITAQAVQAVVGQVDQPVAVVQAMRVQPTPAAEVVAGQAQGSAAPEVQALSPCVTSAPNA